MHCPQCGHANITAFEFCEECLAILPNSSWAQRSKDAFDFDDERMLESMRAIEPADEERDVSLFPWNPENHDVGDLIGRDRELKKAFDLFKTTAEQWGGRLALLIGDRGTGTSTFVARLKAEVMKADRSVLWAQAHCRNEATRPYAVFGRLLCDFLSLPPLADDWAAGEALLEATLELTDEGQPESEAAEIAYLVAFLVGFKIDRSPYLSPSDSDAQTLIPRASQALTRFFRRTAFNSPVVLVLDEAHRAPAPLLALVDLLATGMHNVPVLVLAVGRPTLRTAQPGWQALDVVEVPPMNRADAELALSRLLEGIDDVKPDLVSRVVDKSGGNPYALRAIVRYLHETGVICPTDGGARWIVDDTVFFDLDIPDTLRGVASARLANLTSNDLKVLQQAAVVGTQFWFGSLVMLQRLSADYAVWSAAGVGKDKGIVMLKAMLDGLVAREILVRRSDRSLPGEDAYAFRSDVDAELLYEQMPSRTRRKLHRRVAQWLELQQPRFVESNLPRIAMHHEIGGDSPRAASFYQRAARRARSSFHNNEAIDLYERALRLTSDDELPQRLSTLKALGSLYATVGRNDRAIGVYRRMLRNAWVMRSRGRGAVALNKLGQIHRSMGDYDTSRDHLIQALQLYRSIHDSRGVADALDDLGQLAWLTGDTARALLTYERSKKLRTQLKDPRGLALTLHYIGCVHLDRSDMQSAEKHLLDALALRRKLQDNTGVSMTLNNLGVIYWSRGDVKRATEAWKESLVITQEIGNRPVAAMLMTNLAESCMHSGEFDGAASYLEEAQAIAESAGDRRTLASVLVNASALAMARGEHTAALGAINRASQEAEKLGNLRLLGVARITQGDITCGMSHAWDEKKGVEDGLRLIRQGLATLEKADCELDRAGALEQLSDVLTKLGRADASKKTRAEATAIFKRRGVRPPPKPSVAWEALTSTSAPIVVAEKALVAPAEAKPKKKAAKKKAAPKKVAPKKAAPKKKPAPKKKKAASKKKAAPKKKAAAKTAEKAPARKKAAPKKKKKKPSARPQA